MSFESPGSGGLDYFPARYGQSRLMMRGPWRAPQAGYAVALGGSVTYGRFVPTPWPQLIEAATGRMVLNLGIHNAGPDALLNDPDLLALAHGAALRLLLLPGAVNLSNPFYSVHPRRNDRFIAATPRLRDLYPEIDFMDFAFTHHMIGALVAQDAPRFAEVARVLADCWLDRMGALLAALGGPTILIRYADRPAARPGEAPGPARGGPFLVDGLMIQALRSQASGYAEVLVPDFAGSLAGKVFAPLERSAAAHLPGPAEHEAIARGVLPWVVRLSGK